MTKLIAAVRSLRPLFVAAGLCWTSVSLAAEVPAAPLPRHALVIGNSQYKEGKLVNPVNDAKAMAERLRLAGFNVNLKLDAGRQELQDAINDFGSALKRDKGVGMFYYAGHGLQLNWRNFLVPVDARIRNKADIQAQTVDLGLLVDQLSRAGNALNLVILDACRNNPFGPDFRIDDKGLSQLDAPPGTLLAYATAPGNTAEDGEGSHGLYTDNLLKEMQNPGAPVEDVFKRVRLAVRRASNGGQIPWESTSLEADFSFSPGASPRNPDQEFADDLAAWMELRAATGIEPLEAFIRRRPNGKFAEMAQFRLDQLLAASGEKPIKARAALAPEACPAGSVAPYAGNARPFQPGESYSYRRINLLTQEEKNRYRSTVSQLKTEAGQDLVLWDDGKTVTDPFGNNVRAPDGRQWTPYQFFIDDYHVGKHWQAQFIVTLADGKQISNTFDLHVVGRERITLPAGTFDAFRIEAKGRNLSNGASLERRFWLAPDKFRGFLAMESLSRKNGQVLEGERTELVGYEPKGSAQPSSGWGY